MTDEWDLAASSAPAEAPQAILARCQQAMALAGKTQREEVGQLLEMLGDPQPLVRWEACRALAATAGLYSERPRLGTSLAVRPSRAMSFAELREAIAAKLHSPEPYVRAAAAEALGLWRQTGVIGMLVEALQDEDPSVRSSAATALGHIGDQEALKPLVAALKDPSLWVRRAATEALGRIGDVHAVSALQAVLQREPPLVRAAAAAALGHFATSPARRALITCLKDESAEVRWQAVRSLERIGDLKT
ncbi:MAG: HEAT repeat domain-containing protein, partial [Chloroflexi bacterium]|nr:HEAT repeat domain-containing protein [Chloroflexota bacterium]